MQVAHGIRRQSDGIEFVIAVFDDWDALQTVLEDMVTEHGPRLSATVLHARKDNPKPAVSSCLSNGSIQLHFARSNQYITCTSGDVAEGLAARLASGARTLADALHSWMSSDQAWQLQCHIEKGRLVLWLPLTTSEEFGAVCGRLVHASPHMIGLCNIDFRARP